MTSLANETTARTNGDAALSGRLDTLEADPTTQALLDAETTARTTADSALDGRVATLEGNAAITDPTTATAVAAVQSDVDANETASVAADGALSGRLDVLEADPTTQAAVDTKLNASAVSAYGLTLVDDADAATARTTLGLGDVATTAAADYATAAQGALADTAVQPAAISNIDNTSDADKPVSTAQQTAIDAVQTDVDNNEAAANTALALPRPPRRHQHPWSVCQRCRCCYWWRCCRCYLQARQRSDPLPRELIFRYINLKSVVSRVGFNPQPFFMQWKSSLRNSLKTGAR